MRCRYLFLALTLVFFSAVPADAQGPCLIVGGGSSGDRRLAGEACARAGERFQDLFGSESPAALIDIADSLRIFGVHGSEDGWVVHWPSSRRLVDIYADPGLVEVAWQRKLPHEVAHLMMFSLAAEVGLAAKPGEYTTAFPDWIDEGAALWMEPPQERAALVALRRERVQTPSAREIAEWKHPHLGSDDWISSLARTIALPCPTEARCYRPRWSETMIVTQRLEAHTMVADTVYTTSLGERKHVLDGYFNLYSHALLRFVHERGGADGVTTIIERLAGGAEPFDALIGAPGLPSTAVQLEREWTTWFSTRHLNNQ